MSNKYLQFIKEYIIVALACVVMAFNINYFFVGNKLAEGGVSGLSLIIHYLSNIDVSYLYFALNIPLIILAYIFLGMAMTALGMSVNFKVIKERGMRVFVACFLSSTILMIVCYLIAKFVF